MRMRLPTWIALLALNAIACADSGQTPRDAGDACVRGGDAATSCGVRECFSPTNLGTTLDPNGLGCPCTPSKDQAVCVPNSGGLALYCTEGSMRWTRGVDGPCQPRPLHPAADGGVDGDGGSNDGG